MKATHVVAVTLALVGGLTAGRLSIPATAQQQQPPNYLLIDECKVPPGTVFADLIAEATRWNAEFRKTGEYKSVRLFVHSYGPNLSIYSLREPKNWQSIPAGFEKFVAANPEFMRQPFRCAEHSDNILAEVPVP